MQLVAFAAAVVAAVAVAVIVVEAFAVELPVAAVEIFD